MQGHYLVLLLVAGTTAWGFDAKAYVGWTGTHGQRVDAAYLNSITKGTLPGSGWRLVGTGGVIDTNFSLPFFEPAVVEGMSYSGHGSYVLRGSHASEWEYRFEFDDSDGDNAVVWPFWFWSTSDGQGHFDLVQVATSSGDSATFQLNNGRYIPHTDVAPGSGPPIDVDHTKPHFFVMTFRLNGGDMDLVCYDTNGVLRGQTSWPISTGRVGARWVTFGNANPHGDFPSGNIYFGLMAPWWGSNDQVRFPIGVPNEDRPQAVRNLRVVTP